MTKRQIFLLIGDILIVLAAFRLALIIRLGQTLGDFLTAGPLLAAGLLVAVYISSFYVFELYDIRFNIRTTRTYVSILGAFFLALLLVVILFYIFPYRLGRGVFLISWLLTAALIFSWRFIYIYVFRLLETRRRVVILSNNANVDKIVAGLRDDQEYSLASVLPMDLVKPMLAADNGDPCGLETYMAENRINDVIADFDECDSPDLDRALISLKMKGMHCYSVETFYEKLFKKLPVLALKDRWLLTCGGFDNVANRGFNVIKRAFDLSAAAILFIATIPVFIILAMLIPLTSKGPVFFIQERLGQGKMPFKMIKFRTMVDGAEPSGPTWAQEHDGRATKLGKFMRRTRLDELPQLLNVLKSDMSLIGPRPEREFFVNRLSKEIPFYELRFFVKPGITGWAQIKYRYCSDKNDALEKLRYELYYIKNQSIGLDVRIMLSTVRVMITGAGT